MTSAAIARAGARKTATNKASAPSPWALALLGLLFAALVLSRKPEMLLRAELWGDDGWCMIPMLAWIGVLFTLAADRNCWLRGIGVALLLVLLLWAVPHDRQERPILRTDFIERARAFEAAPPGTRMAFPIHPPGLSPMVLVKLVP